MNEKIIQEVTAAIEGKRDLFIDVSDRIWGFAETRFQEFRSAELLCTALEQEGFTVEKGVAELETGFVGSFGSGSPVVAILGEFDALASLSQRAGEAAFHPIVPGANGKPTLERPPGSSPAPPAAPSAPAPSSAFSTDSMARRMVST